MKRYIFNTQSQDCRPITHCDWFVIGIGELKGKRFWKIALFLEDYRSEDVYTYYPEAYEINLTKVPKFEIVRGGDINVIPALRELEFSDGIDYVSKDVSPELIFVVRELSRQRLSDAQISRRLGISSQKWKSIKKNESVRLAIKSGIDNYLENIKL